MKHPIAFAIAASLPVLGTMQVTNAEDMKAEPAASPTVTTTTTTAPAAPATTVKAGTETTVIKTEPVREDTTAGSDIKTNPGVGTNTKTGTNTAEPTADTGADAGTKTNVGVGTNTKTGDDKAKE